MEQSNLLVRLFSPLIQLIISFQGIYQTHRINIHSFLKNSFWLTFAQSLSGFANLAITIYLARSFGPTTYGLFAYSISFVMLFSALFDFGLTMATTREFARDQGQEEHFSSILILKAIIGIATMSLIFGLSFVVTVDPYTRQIIIALGFYQLFLQILNIFYAVFRARQRMDLEALIRLFSVGLLGLLVVVFISYGRSLRAISLSYVFSTLAALLAALALVGFYFKGNIQLFQNKFNLSECKKYLKVGFYLALAQGVGDIMTNTDSFLIGYLGMVKNVGLYNAASKINTIILFPMSIVSAAIFPILITSLKKSEDDFKYYWLLWVRITLFFAVMLAFLVISHPSNVISLFFSSDYLVASRTLEILMLMTIVLYIGNSYYQMLVIFNQQRAMYYGLLSGCIVNVVLNLMLIPRFGIEGSAVATVAGQFVSTICYMWISKRATLINPLSNETFQTILVPISTGILMLLCLKLLKMPFIMSVILGSSIFTGSYFLLNRLFAVISSNRVQAAKKGHF